VNPVGAHVYWTPPHSRAQILCEVVDVIADVRALPEEEAPYMVYVPFWEWPP
jgi:hypothetical protein